jgi:hypothetical protein
MAISPPVSYNWFFDKDMQAFIEMSFTPMFTKPSFAIVKHEGVTSICKDQQHIELARRREPEPPILY